VRATSPGHRSVFSDLVMCRLVSFVPHLEFFLVDSSCSVLLSSCFTGLRLQCRARAPLSSFRSSVGAPQNPPHQVSRPFTRPPRSALRSPGFSCCLQVRSRNLAVAPELVLSLPGVLCSPDPCCSHIFASAFCFSLELPHRPARCYLPLLMIFLGPIVISAQGVPIFLSSTCIDSWCSLTRLGIFGRY
jgi:hypothetical protein